MILQSMAYTKDKKHADMAFCSRNIHFHLPGVIKNFTCFKTVKLTTVLPLCTHIFIIYSLPDKLRKSFHNRFSLSGC